MMETPEATQAPSPPHAGAALVPPTAIEPQLRLSDESTHDYSQHPPGSINVLSANFLESVSRIFGKPSQEQTVIDQALHDFITGRLSKCDAHYTMSQVVGDHAQLKRGLLDILYHEDAKWGPGDFYQLEAARAALPVANKPHLDFLQPQHYPQIRMPRISTDWYPDQYDTRTQLPPLAPQSINPALFRSPLAQSVPDPNHSQIQHYEAHEMNIDASNIDGAHSKYGYNSGDRNDAVYAHNAYLNWSGHAPTGNGSPALPTRRHVSMPQHYAASAVAPTRTFSSYSEHGYFPDFSSSGCENTESRHHSYFPSEKLHDGSVRAALPSSDFDYRIERLQKYPGTHQAYPSTVSSTEMTPQLTSPYQGSYNATPTAVGTSGSMQYGQPASEMLLPMQQDRNHTVGYASMESGHGEAQELGYRMMDPPQFAAPVFADRSQEDRTDHRPRRERAVASGLAGDFIHAICGKSFQNRTAVKKHHWGRAKVDDISTKTGCWAKSGRPNRAWDEHPSCRQGPKQSHSTRKSRSSEQPGDVRPTTSEIRAPVITGSTNANPGIHALQHLPKTVEKTVAANPGPFKDSQIYDTHHALSFNSLDPLLTAVNVVSNVDAPKPQARNDSVVSSLDAQAVAAERYRQHFQPWTGDSAPIQSHLQNQYQALSPRTKDLGVTEAEGLPAKRGITEPGACENEFRTRANMMAASMVVPSQQHQAGSNVSRTNRKAEDAVAPAKGALGRGNESRPADPAEDKGKGCATTRRSGGRTAIAKNEPKMLGLSVSPGPDKKKQKV